MIILICWWRCVYCQNTIKIGRSHSLWKMATLVIAVVSMKAVGRLADVVSKAVQLTIKGGERKQDFVLVLQ